MATHSYSAGEIPPVQSCVTNDGKSRLANVMAQSTANAVADNMADIGTI
jgi:hypothetical protein